MAVTDSDFPTLDAINAARRAAVQDQAAKRAAAGETPAITTSSATDRVYVLDTETATRAFAVLNTSGAAPVRNETIIVAIGDETTAITTGTAKVTFRMPFALTLTAVRASVATASSSGLPTFDIKENGVSILGTKLSIDANEKSSTTAATPATITDNSLADDSEITIDVTVAGTGAAGAKITLIGTV